MSVVVQHYDPEWPSHFQMIKSELETHLKGVPILSIEHVGSTSVPGLAAKPIIDIDIIVTRENVQPTISALIKNGNFTNLGELGIIDRHAVRDPNQSPARNIYVCVNDAFQTRNHLGVRDTLRSNPALRDEYGRVKLELAAHGTDIVAYTQAKTDVLQKILIDARLLTQEELMAIRAANRTQERFGAIATERLVLREFVMGDVDAFYELESFPEVVRYNTWPPLSKDRALEEVVKIIQGSCTVPRAHIELAVTYNDRFIGRVGTNITRNETEVPSANLWYSFMPEWQGKGFATEAMKKFIDLLERPLLLRIECDPANAGSVKMAERLGFKKIRLTEKAFECKGKWVNSLEFEKLV